MFVTYPLDRLGALAPRPTHPCTFRRDFPADSLSKIGFTVDGKRKTDEVDGRFLVPILVRAGHGRRGDDRSAHGPQPKPITTSEIVCLSRNP